MTHSAGSPAIALVICTRNRSSALPACLAALTAMDFDPHAWELIVVDNGSTDATTEIAQAFAEQVPFKVKVVKEPRNGLGRARNSGVEATSAKLIAFTDDDCYAAPDYLTRLVEAFQNPAYGYVGGRVLLHDPSDARKTIREDLDAEEFDPHLCLEPGVIHGANMAVRRDVWQDIGGFDPLFGAGARLGAGEDIDFLTRASAEGWSGAYLPGPMVRHHHARKPGVEIDRLYATYGLARGAYYTKCFLNRSIRAQSIRRWSWHLGGHLRHGRLRMMIWEIVGAVKYLFYRHQLLREGEDAAAV